MKLKVDDKVRVKEYTKETQPVHWNSDGLMLEYCGNVYEVFCVYAGALGDRVQLKEASADNGIMWYFDENDLELVDVPPQEQSSTAMMSISILKELATCILQARVDVATDNFTDDEIMEAILDAIGCMEKSMPKKPNVCLSNGKVFSATCMRCMKPVLEDWISCPYCSGARDWRDHD